MTEILAGKTKKSTVEITQDLTEQYPTLQVIGSLARAAYMGLEFDELRPSGVRRDVDALRMGPRDEAIPESEDVDLDLLFENWIRPEANGTYLVFPHDPKLAVEVPFADEVFAPQEVQIQGSAIRAPRPETLGAISTMQYIQRPKDKKAMAVYDGYLASLDDSSRLSPSLLKPFDDFRNELAKRKSYIRRSYARNAYHVVVPEKYRKKLDLGEKVHWLRSR